MSNPHAQLRLVSGVLKGYDQLLNLVLDEGIEYLRGMYWPVVHARHGRGPNMVLCPIMLRSRRPHAGDRRNTEIGADGEERAQHHDGILFIVYMVYAYRHRCHITGSFGDLC